ncbi:MAG: hypothetical protein Q9213_005655 [Squamulea squamosa]
MAFNATQLGLHEGPDVAQFGTAPEANIVGQLPMSEKTPESQPKKGLPIAAAFKNLKKTTAVAEKIEGEVLAVEEIRQLLRDNSTKQASTNDPTDTIDAKAVVNIFTKQVELMEKYTKRLEVLEKQTKQPEPVEAVTAMVEHVHVQTEALMTSVKQDEDDLSEELQHQLETVLTRTEEALERLMDRLKRKAAAGRGLATEKAHGNPNSSDGKP